MEEYFPNCPVCNEPVDYCTGGCIEVDENGFLINRITGEYIED